MNEDQFHVILPSNSSMKYYPHNTTTRFTTQLPHEIRLHGRWVVGLVEIQFPKTFLHVRHDSSNSMENRVAVLSNMSKTSKETEKEETATVVNTSDNTYQVQSESKESKIKGKDLLRKFSLPYIIKSETEFDEINDNEIRENYQSNVVDGVWREPLVSFFRPGVYTKINDLVKAINNTVIGHEHVKLVFREEEDCYVKIVKICSESCQIGSRHFFVISEKVSRILGFAPLELISTDTHFANHPPSLARGLPEKMFIYCDICESHITGDVKTPLLRIIPVETRDYVFASTQITQFASPNYIPLLHTEFRTIEIDIRDHLGLPIPFEFGTLTVTLHFKRID